MSYSIYLHLSERLSGVRCATCSIMRTFDRVTQTLGQMLHHPRKEQTHHPHYQSRLASLQQQQQHLIDEMQKVQPSHAMHMYDKMKQIWNGERYENQHQLPYLIPMLDERRDFMKYMMVARSPKVGGCHVNM